MQAGGSDKSVQTPGYDLTVFKVKWGRLTLKIYDKGERVLRVEVVVHNTKELRCGKVLDKLPVMLERMSGMLVRFLDTLQVAHARFLDEGAFEQWGEPTLRGTRRLAGLDLHKVRNRSVVDAVVGLAPVPDGFTLAQLEETVRQHAGWSADVYSTHHAACDLAKLCGKNFVRRRARSRRNYAEPGGVRTMCAYLILRNKVIKPLLADIVVSPKIISPVDQHYVAPRQKFHRTFETLGRAA